MLNYSQAFYELKNRLQPLYDEREAASIAHEVMHHITGLDKTQRLIQKEKIFTENLQQQSEHALGELLKGVPLQYVTHTAWFIGREYYVDEHVLIPRPETEELVQWVLEKSKPIPIAIGSKSHILDIGTGSGCIPISLKLALPAAEITTCDISNEAINVAKKNAVALNADLKFLHLDFLNTSEHTKMGNFDVIVSNPPYIPVAEKVMLHTNVRDYEPALALFVPDNDTLVFYRAIAAFGKQHLNSNGYIYCELDAGHAAECKILFEEAGYEQVEIKKDMHGNWRILRAGIGNL